MLKKNFAWLFPLIFLIIFAPFSANLDMSIEKYFFNEDGFQTSPFLNFMFDFGVAPAWIVTGICLIILTLSYFSSKWVPWRPYVLLPILTMAIGSGLFVHAALKDHWGRPRPKQVIEFGGGQQFRPFYKPNFFDQPEPSKSFPCGHCSLGFFFFSVAFIGMRLKKAWLAWSGFFLTMLLGVTLGYVRMAQGGHFLSDVLVGAAIMWWTVLLVDWIIFERPAAST